MTDREHPVLRDATRELNEGKLDRRDFLRIATLLGVSAVSAYTMAGLPTRRKPRRRSQEGRHAALGMRVQDLSSPHTYSWIESANSARQSLDYLTHTGPDNITRPHLVEKWTASADLKSWTFVLRKRREVAQGRQEVQRRRRDLEHEARARPQDRLVGHRPAQGLHARRVRDGREGRQGRRRRSRPGCGIANAIEKVDEFTVQPQRQGGEPRHSRGALPLSLPDDGS